jgi:hypothetical protein
VVALFLKRRQEMHYFLFNDLLVRSAPAKIGNKLQCKTIIPLDYLRVSNPKEHLFQAMGNVFQIHHTGEMQTFTVFFAKKEDKQVPFSVVFVVLNCQTYLVSRTGVDAADQVTVTKFNRVGT